MKDCARQVFLAKNTTFLNENFPFVETTFVNLFKINSSEIMANYANLKVRQSATEIVDHQTLHTGSKLDFSSIY